MSRAFSEFDRIRTFDATGLMGFSVPPFTADIDSQAGAIEYHRLWSNNPTASWIGAADVTGGAGNIDQANDCEIGDVLNGVTLTAITRMLFRSQADPLENGLFLPNASGAPTRVTDWDDDTKINAGDVIFVYDGTVDAGTAWTLDSTEPHVPGVDELTFTAYVEPVSGGAAALDDLSDVDLTVAPTDLQGLIYDAGSGTFKAGDIEAGAGGGSMGAVEIIKTFDFSATPSADDIIDVTGFDSVELIWQDLEYAASNSLAVQVGTDAATFATSGYRRHRLHHTGNNSDTAIGAMQLGSYTNTTGLENGSATIGNLQQADFFTFSRSRGHHESSSASAVRFDQREVAEVNTHLKIVSGTIDGGKLIVKGVKSVSTGTSGGRIIAVGRGTVSVAGAWTTAPLSAETVNTIPGASYDDTAKTITLPPGEYSQLKGWANFWKPNHSNVRLWDVTNGVEIEYGGTIYGGAGGNYTSARPEVDHAITLTAETEIRLEYYRETGVGSQGAVGGGDTVTFHLSAMLAGGGGGAAGATGIIAQLSKTTDSGALSAHNNIEAAIIYDTEDVDTTGWIDVGASGSKLIAPSDWTDGDTATFYHDGGWVNVALRVWTTLYKNGSKVHEGGTSDETYSHCAVCTTWPGVVVNADDEFEVIMYAESDGSLVHKGGGRFGVKYD